MSESGSVYFYLTLLRHAQTKENVSQTIQGHMDTHLSEVGISQARDVGDGLKNLKIDAMFCSDLKRASDTAKSIRKCYKRAFVPLHLNPLMRERNFGLNNGQPRSKIHEFIAKAKASHNGCEMWREVQAECGHQIFLRAISFFFELCDFASKRPTQPTPEFPSSNSAKLDQSLNTNPLPILLPLRQKPVPEAIHCSNETLNSDGGTEVCFKDTRYVGHFVLVSHGQWIREFNHILQVLSRLTHGFPTQQSMLAVLSNCQFNQYGVAVDCASLALRAASVRNAVESALSRRLSCPKSCPYEVEQLSDRLPVATVCYHARVDANTIKGPVTSAPAVVVATPEEETAEGRKPAHAGSGVETLYFVREDDEYAGVPPVTWYDQNVDKIADNALSGRSPLDYF